MALLAAPPPPSPCLLSLSCSCTRVLPVLSSAQVEFAAKLERDAATEALQQRLLMATVRQSAAQELQERQRQHNHDTSVVSAELAASLRRSTSRPSSYSPASHRPQQGQGLGQEQPPGPSHHTPAAAAAPWAAAVSAAVSASSPPPSPPSQSSLPSRAVADTTRDTSASPAGLGRTRLGGASSPSPTSTSSSTWAGGLPGAVGGVAAELKQMSSEIEAIMATDYGSDIFSP
jgi:hypothetical protein